MDDHLNEIIRVVCISDTHTHTDFLNIPDGDILIHSGDFTYHGKEEEVIKFKSPANKNIILGT